jgi:hypothetical protein
MNKGVNPYAVPTVIIWWLLTIVAIGLTIAMLGLGLTCLAYTAKNITKIDVMKGKYSLRNKN